MNKPLLAYAAMAFLTFTGASNGIAEPAFPLLEGTYFGQKVPGLNPEVFAPGIVSVENRYEYGVSFTPDFKAMYFTPTIDGASQIFMSKVVNDHWTKPEKISLTNGIVNDEFGALVSAGGGTMMFSTYSEQYPLKVWQLSKDKDNHGEASLLDSPLNDNQVSITSIARYGDIYYQNHDDGKLYIAPRIGGKYPHQYQVAIPHGSQGYISPQQDFLLVEAHKNNDKSKDKDLFVYFKQEDGSWSQPMGLGSAVNSDFRESSPSLTPDGKYLFFNRYDEQSGNPNIYWVSAEVITSAREAWLSKLVAQPSNQAPEIASFEEDYLGFGFEDTLPDLTHPWISTTPPARNDGINVGSLNAIGKQQDKVTGFVKELANNKFGRYDSLLISYKNKLVFESYFNKGRINLPHFQASATKSLNSMAIARAIELGYLSMRDIDQPVINYLSNIDKSKLVDGAEQVTLHKAMNMRSGIKLNDEIRPVILDNQMKVKGFNLMQQILEHSNPIASGRAAFSYQDADPIVTMHLADSLVPGSIWNFYRDEIFGKLGITRYGWRTDSNGVPLAGSSAAITSRDMLKIGSVLLNDGKWQGEQLFSAEFLAKATTAINKTESDWIPEEYNYGYFWYQVDMPVGEQSVSVNMAWGAGGNRIIVVKELDLVIVLTGADIEDKVMPQLANALFPAFTN